LPKVTASTSLLGSFTCRKARHGTDGFTSPPKERVPRIFFARKIRRLRPGLNPRTWVPKASTLPQDHRSRFNMTYYWSESEKKKWPIRNLSLQMLFFSFLFFLSYQCLCYSQSLVTFHVEYQNKSSIPRKKHRVICETSLPHISL
jgi:hypothetical protein